MLAIAGALLGSDAATAAAPTRLEAAGAFFEAREASGCILTRVDISAWRQDHSDGGVAETFITRRNTCTGTDLLRASEAGAQSVLFRANGVGNAALVGSLQVHDFVSGQDLEVLVELAWNGVGAPTVTPAPNQTHTFRQALASGSVTLGGAPLISGDAASAAIEWVSTRQ